MVGRTLLHALLLVVEVRRQGMVSVEVPPAEDVTVAIVVVALPGTVRPEA